MRNHFLYTIIFSLLFVSGCATKLVPTIDYNPATNFSAYKTFAFISDHPLIRAQGAEGGNPLAEGRMMNNVENILANRGYTRVSDPESADFAISFTVGGRDQIRVDSYPATYRGSYGAWGRGWGGGYYGAQTVNVSSYTEGILSIDIFDAKQHQPVWHGRASKRITDKMLKDPGPVITEVVTAIMASFPPI